MEIFYKNINCLFLLFTVIVNAQNQQHFGSQPPIHNQLPQSIWQFSKYGNVPVNEYRGLVNISIPIYDLKCDDVNIPLKVDYYSGGIKVSEEASIVGLGWSFNIPTVIQQIKDVNDYYSQVIHQKLPPFQGNPALPSVEVFNNYGFWNTNLNQSFSIGSIQNIPYMIKTCSSDATMTGQTAFAVLIDETGHYNIHSKYLEMVKNSLVDSEPDIFTVYMNGVELKFCREESTQLNYNLGNYELLPLKIINGHNEYKVELVENTNSTSELRIKGVKITDPNGDIYFFTNSVTDGILSSTALTYKLDKIITNKGKEINFNYSQVANDVYENKGATNKFIRRTGSSNMSGGAYSPSYAFYGMEFTSWGFETGLFANAYFFGGEQIDSFSYGDVGGSFTTDVNAKTFLESINSDNENIIFKYSDRIDYHNMKKLDEIEIQNNKNQKIKKIIFSYDYFSSDSSLNSRSIINNINANNQEANNAISNRLKLISISEEGNEPYLFEYNDTLLPKKNSFAVDYWGYFNGSNNINGFLNLTVLGYPQFTENDSNNFNSNLNYAKANILEKIIYPTKGYTKFEYELNEFDNLITYHGINTPIINYGAGLRIKSVTNFNFDDNIISKKNYSYYGGKSILKRVLTKESFQQWSDCYRVVSATPIITSSNSNCINQSNNIEGDYIGYDKVIIKEEGSTYNGSIEKTFSNSGYNAINPYNEFASAQYYLNTNSIDNGSLLTEKIFDSNNYLKLSKQYKYQNVVANLDTYGMAVQSDGVRVVYGTQGYDNINNCTDIVVLPRCLLTFYPIYDKFSRLIEESSYESFDSGSFAKKSMFEYDSKNNLVVKTDKVLPNTIISKTVTSMTYNNNINHLNKHLFKLPLEKRVQENETLEKSTNYFYDDLQYTKLARIEEHSRGGNSNEFTRKIFYDLYDDKNNVLEYHLENGIYTSIIWGYRQTLPIAKIENIRYSDIESYIGTIQNTSNEIDSSELFNQLKAFRTLISSQFPNAMITTFTQLPLVGVETITDPKGKTNTYTYDSLNRLQYVKDNDGNILSENEYHFRP